MKILKSKTYEALIQNLSSTSKEIESTKAELTRQISDFKNDKSDLIEKHKQERNNLTVKIAANEEEISELTKDRNSIYEYCTRLRKDEELHIKEKTDAYLEMAELRDQIQDLISELESLKRPTREIKSISEFIYETPEESTIICAKEDNNDTEDTYIGLCDGLDSCDKEEIPEVELEVRTTSIAEKHRKYQSKKR